MLRQPWFTIVLLLTVLLLVPGRGSSEPISGGVKQVVFIRYRIAPNNFQTVVDNFKAGMARRGYLQGEHVEYIDILTSTADERSVPEVIEAVNRYKHSADMFITCGWVSLYARKLLKGTGVPQLFVPVLESVAHSMLDSLVEEPGTNLSGTYLMYPPEKILRVAKFVNPQMKKYAYVYDSRIPADMIFKTAYENVSRSDRYDSIEIVTYDLAAGVEQVAQAMKEEGVEAYGGIVGAFKNRKALAGAGIPLVTALTLDIDEGEVAAQVGDELILAGLYNPFSYCGEQAAIMTADIFDGAKTIRQTRPRPARQVAFINLRAAERLGLHISFEVLEAVDLVIK